MNGDPRTRARIAEPSATPAAARSSSAAGCAIGCWRHASPDVDLEVFGVPGDRLRTLLEAFGRVEAVGESFQVYKIGDIDVSLPRRDSKAGRGHRGFVVAGDPDMSIEEAARRRDFTINAISWDPLTDEYFDPFDGRGDLERRAACAWSIRRRSPTTACACCAPCSSPRGSSFGSTRTTRALCRTIPLDDLAVRAHLGRIRETAASRRGRRSASRSRWISASSTALFPELQALVGCPQEPEWHPEGDVWVHTLQVIDQARTRIDDLPRPQQIAVMLGAVCHDLGKPATTAFIDGRIRSMDHEEQGVAPAPRFSIGSTCTSIDGYDVRRQVLGITAQHLKPGSWFKVRDEVGDGAFRRLAHKVDLELLARVAKSDCEGRKPGTFDCSAMDWFLERARALGVEQGPACADPARTPPARDSGLTPGPRVGEILKAVYEQQMDGSVTNLDEAITVAKRLL